MTLANDLCRAGRGINLAEKEAVLVFLVSRILGSNALRRRVCEFVLTKKELYHKDLDDAAQRRFNAIAERLSGKIILSAKFTFSDQAEGIELLLKGEEPVVLSGRKCDSDGRPLRSVMWVRPSFADLTNFHVESIDMMVLVNPFVTDRYAEPDAFGKRYVRTCMEALLLSGDGGEVLLGGHAGCTGCGEGCRVHAIPLQLFPATDFRADPQIAFGHIRLMDGFNHATLDEFGSRVDWTDLWRLNAILVRYPLSSYCADTLHHDMDKLFGAFCPGCAPTHSLEVVYVSDKSVELPGDALLENEGVHIWEEAYEARVGYSVVDLQVSYISGFAPSELEYIDLCAFVVIDNPTLEEVEAVLMFASSATFFMGPSFVLVVCMLDVTAEHRRPFLRALYDPPSQTSMLFEEEPEAWMGSQCCIVGAGIDHLINGHKHYSACQLDDDERGGAADIENSLDPEESVIQDMPPEDLALLAVDPPAEIDANESHCIAERLWESSIIRLAAGTFTMQSDAQSPERPRLCLLTFGRHPEALDSVILESQLARSLTSQGITVKPFWANGAKVLTGHLAPGNLDIDLCPRHVIVEQEAVQQVLDGLKCLPYNSRPRLKLGAGQEDVPSWTSLLQDLSENEDVGSHSWELNSDRSFNTYASGSVDQHKLISVHELPVQRTFIHFAVPEVVRPRARSI
mmetsp:Transcript_70829/g.207549  ORF Transcript_70829/g.207549 Transcript_70829/m.207549 type:complete len:683 (+) Transcript_70829:60-2108(+)